MNLLRQIRTRSWSKQESKTKKLQIDTSKVQTDMVVDVRWLHDNLGKNKVVVVDARSRAAYEKGHIEGAISFEPMTSGLRTGAESKMPFTLVDHKKVTDILSRAGLAADDHIVVYDQSGLSAMALLAVLQWAGADNVSYLATGIEGWHAAGYHTSTVPATRKAS